MEAVKIVECPRDAWQGLKRQIPTERKAEYLRALVAAGFKHIDAVSFVSPKAVPQMTDSEAVLEQLGPTPGVELIGIVVNEKGAERAIATGAVTALGYPCSISPTFLRRNQNQSVAENLEILRKLQKRADTAGLGTVAYISMAFGNPYGDFWSEEEVAQAARTILDAGVRTLSLADTAGNADADLIARVIAAVLEQSKGEFELGVHLHSARTKAGPKILAAYDAGGRRFDCAIGGLGGCPFAQDELVGNVATEEVLKALNSRGCRTTLDLRAVAQLSSAIGAEFAGSD